MAFGSTVLANEGGTVGTSHNSCDASELRNMYRVGMGLQQLRIRKAVLVTTDRCHEIETDISRITTDRPLSNGGRPNIFVIIQRGPVVEAIHADLTNTDLGAVVWADPYGGDPLAKDDVGASQGSASGRYFAGEDRGKGREKVGQGEEVYRVMEQAQTAKRVASCALPCSNSNTLVRLPVVEEHLGGVVVECYDVASDADWVESMRAMGTHNNIAMLILDAGPFRALLLPVDIPNGRHRPDPVRSHLCCRPGVKFILEMSDPIKVVPLFGDRVVAFNSLSLVCVIFDVPFVLCTLAAIFLFFSLSALCTCFSFLGIYGSTVGKASMRRVFTPMKAAEKRTGWVSDTFSVESAGNGKRPAVLELQSADLSSQWDAGGQTTAVVSIEAVVSKFMKGGEVFCTVLPRCPSGHDLRRDTIQGYIDNCDAIDGAECDECQANIVLHHAHHLSPPILAVFVAHTTTPPSTSFEIPVQNMWVTTGRSACLEGLLDTVDMTTDPSGKHRGLERDSHLSEKKNVEKGEKEDGIHQHIVSEVVELLKSWTSGRSSLERALADSEGNQALQRLCNLVGGYRMDGFEKITSRTE
ncbi:hypothetical protein ARMSODRAFT_981803 [Armillaria solidipes]|uniref:Uncharacterized protein n=1 Tax=Armillaria solidipes TaxID=1076256 RepID=A0A2H3B1Y4_9AGAR|nr:hypothetical protein ARMSODRAFT_981803 [Armillaria solidipes]